MIEYQNQIIKLVEDVSKVDTDNKLFKQRIEQNEKYYQKILDRQSKEFDIYIKQQKINHDTEIDNLFFLFHIVVSMVLVLLALIAFGLNYFGKKAIKKAIEKEIKANHEVVTADQINKLSNSQQFVELIRATIINMDDSSEEEVEEDDSLQ